MIGLAVALYVTEGCGAKPGDLKPLARGDMAKLEVEAAGPPAPSGSFLDAQGQPTNLGRLKARVVVVNLWATWCGPCVTEMPTLAKLQAAYPVKITVVPISVDKNELRERARAFIGEHPPLAFYQDPNLTLPFAVTPPAEGFPTTIIYGRDGRERARLSGGADWDGPDARAVFDTLLAQR